MRGAILHSVLDFIAVQARAALADGNRPMIWIRTVLARVKISSCSMPLKLVLHDSYFCRISPLDVVSPQLLCRIHLHNMSCYAEYIYII